MFCSPTETVFTLQAAKSKNGTKTLLGKNYSKVVSDVSNNSQDETEEPLSKEKLKYLRYFRLVTHRKRNGMLILTIKYLLNRVTFNIRSMNYNIRRVPGLKKHASTSTTKTRPAGEANSPANKNGR